MNTPKIKPYTPSKESLELQRMQIEAKNEAQAELAERQARVAKRNQLRPSLIAANIGMDQTDTLGVS